MKMQRTYSKENYCTSLLLFERFLAESHNKLGLSSEHSVYLAGMLARQYDKKYRRQIHAFLFRTPQELQELARCHKPYLGQKAPIYFASRINAEYLTAKFILRWLKGLSKMEQDLPAYYFHVASIYAYQIGLSLWGAMFSFMYQNYRDILQLLCSYAEFLKSHELHIISPVLSSLGPLPSNVWERLGVPANERNNKKELWEMQNISPKRKAHIPRHEFNEIFNFSPPN